METGEDVAFRYVEMLVSVCFHLTVDNLNGV